jgi:hypothetical protein
MNSIFFSDYKKTIVQITKSLRLMFKRQANFWLFCNIALSYEL